MLTSDQEKWVAQLSDDVPIKIIPFDPTAEEKFQKVRERVWSVLGTNVPVEHHGATSLGISGQDEIDLYIPVPPQRFGALINPLTEVFGAPASLYPLERARFEVKQDDKHVTLFLVNSEGPAWKDSVRFETYLRQHPEALERYRKLKESGDGLSMKEYYRRKIEFINEILDLASDGSCK